MTGVASDSKSAAAFRTIGEVAQATGIAPHILRYWEGRFPQLRPVTRAGNRRYYRPADVVLIERIDRLLNRDGYTIRGVQQLLAAERAPAADAAGAADGAAPVPQEPAAVATPAAPEEGGPPLTRPALAQLRVIRDFIAEALEEPAAYD
jgi:DNA-binding transcriptional MerR regulator